jgi:hypothetical protein
VLLYLKVCLHICDKPWYLHAGSVLIKHGIIIEFVTEILYCASSSLGRIRGCCQVMLLSRSWLFHKQWIRSISAKRKKVSSHRGNRSETAGNVSRLWKAGGDFGGTILTLPLRCSISGLSGLHQPPPRKDHPLASYKHIAGVASLDARSTFAMGRLPWYHLLLLQTCPRKSSRHAVARGDVIGFHGGSREPSV